MQDSCKTDRLLNALRAAREQLHQAVADRDEAWLALARIATAKSLKESDLRRLAMQACPQDPWDLQIDFEQRGSRVAERPKG